MAARVMGGISAALPCAGAVRACGMCSETEEKSSAIILAFEQLEKDLTEAPDLRFHDCINLLLAPERNSR